MSFLGLPYRILIVELVKKRTRMETMGRPPVPKLQTFWGSYGLVGTGKLSLSFLWLIGETRCHPRRIHSRRVSHEVFSIWSCRRQRRTPTIIRLQSTLYRKHALCTSRQEKRERERERAREREWDCEWEWDRGWGHWDWDCPIPKAKKEERDRERIERIGLLLN